MASAQHCFDFLLGKTKLESLPEVVALFGDDPFLRRETCRSLLECAQLNLDEIRSFDGEECKWIDVHDELATLSLFDTDARRVAIVTAADKLVKDSRAQLEKWCAAPADSSLLILQIATFQANTKLYKLVDKNGLNIQCSLPTSGGRSKAPNLGKVRDWLIAWANRKHDVKLTNAFATQIMDAVGTDCGLLHQELAKLALYAAPDGSLTEAIIRENLGSWRTRTMWEIADAIADGNAKEALSQLEKVFAAGEHPAAVIPQVSWSLRRFAKAAHLILQGKRTGQPISAKVAIGQCGFWGADAALAEQRLRKMGLRRASKLGEWLLDLDLAIKGTHSQPARAIQALELLCFKFV